MSSFLLRPVPAAIWSILLTVSSLIRMEKVLYPSSPFGRFGLITSFSSFKVSPPDKHILCLQSGDKYVRISVI